MVMASLHIICGNCGSKDDLTYRIDPRGNCNFDGEEYPAVYISCGNCTTLHNLNDTVDEKK